MPAQPPDGFAAFVGARGPALHRAAWLLTGDESRAEDLLQIALAAAWRHWTEIAEGHPEAYVRRILYTTYASWWRRRWRFEYPTADLPERADRRDHAAEHADRDAVLRALAKLTRQQRVVLVARFLDDLSIADTARLLGCSEQTVKVQSSRALARLRTDPHLRHLRPTPSSPTFGGQRDDT
jgi:RNA polymerase sigma-70 factor (sigma-E family)